MNKSTDDRRKRDKNQGEFKGNIYSIDSKRKANNKLKTFKNSLWLYKHINIILFI